MIDKDFLTTSYYYLDGYLYRTSDNTRIGSIDKYGYGVIQIRNKKYRTHRLIWLYHYGVWPTGPIDHINGIRSDNTIENLREATTQQNNFNRKPRNGISSTYKGLSWHRRNKKWQVQYQLNGNMIYVGLYECEIEAAKAYDEAVRKHQREFMKANV